MASQKPTLWKITLRNNIGVSLKHNTYISIVFQNVNLTMFAYKNPKPYVVLENKDSLLFTKAFRNYKE